MEIINMLIFIYDIIFNNYEIIISLLSGFIIGVLRYGGFCYRVNFLDLCLLIVI